MKFLSRVFKKNISLDLNKPKLLTRFLISYIVILSIPVIFMGFFAFNNAIKELTKEVEDATMTKLEQAMDMIDMRLEGLNHLAAQLPRNQNIGTFLYARDINKLSEYEFYLMLKALKDYRATNVFIDNIYIYFRDTDVFVSADGKYDMYTFFSQVLKYDKITESEFIEMLNSIPKGTYRPAEDVYSGSSTKEIISYLQPIPMFETNPKAALLISMEASSINKLLSNALGGYKGNSYILDQNGNRISSINHINDDILEDDILNLTQKPGGYNVQYKKINGTNTMVCFIQSKKTGWSYLALIPSKQILSKVINIKILAVIILLLAVVIGTVMAFFFSYSNYHPIKEMAERLTKYSSNGFESKYNNELDVINNVLTTIISKDDSMEYLLNKYIPSIRANFLMRLLNGDFMSKQEVNEIAKFVKLSIPAGPFAVMIFDIDDYDDFIKLNSVMTQSVYRFSIGNVAEELCQKTGNEGYVVDISGDKVAMIIDFNMGNKRYIEQMSNIGNDIIGFFAKHFEFGLTVGIGRVYEDIMDISKSYVEAQTAIEYKMVKGKNTIIVFNDMITANNSNHYYTLYHENIIINSLKLGEFESINQILSSVIEDIDQNPVSINMAKCIYFEIINTAMKALGELDPQDYNEVMNHGDILPNFFECETLMDVYDETVNFYKIICARIKKIRENDVNEIKNNILEYVQKNYNDKDMSLLLLSDRFDQTPSSLSRLFKHKTGYNFIDYLHILRLNRAKELLKSTDINISDIAIECGYLNSHSFIRCFKKYNLITPGRFRELSELEAQCKK